MMPSMTLQAVLTRSVTLGLWFFATKHFAGNGSSKTVNSSGLSGHKAVSTSDEVSLLNRIQVLEEKLNESKQDHSILERKMLTVQQENKAWKVLMKAKVTGPKYPTNAEKHDIRADKGACREAYSIGRRYFIISEKSQDLKGFMEYLSEIPGQENVGNPSQSEVWQKLMSWPEYSDLDGFLMTASKLLCATFLPDYFRDIYLNIERQHNLPLFEILCRTNTTPLEGGELDFNQRATLRALGDYFFTSIQSVHPRPVVNRSVIDMNFLKKFQLELLAAAAEKK